MIIMVYMDYLKRELFCIHIPSNHFHYIILYSLCRFTYYTALLEILIRHAFIQYNYIMICINASAILSIIILYCQ